MELDAYTVPGAVADGRWLYEQNSETCTISTGATQIDGRTLLTQRPTLMFSRKRNTDNVDEIDIYMAKSNLFDTSLPISMTAGGTHQLLHVDAENITMAQQSDGSWSREVTRTLRYHQGEVQMVGASTFGGTLKLTFSTDGFERAFRAMAAECGPGATYWIDDWGAVAKDSDSTIWHTTKHGNEEKAKEAAMKECTSRSQTGGCAHYASFRDQCWSIASGQRGKDDWGTGWANDTTLESAKTLSLEACANDGGKKCEIVMHVCADGSNEWEASAE